MPQHNQNAKVLQSTYSYIHLEDTNKINKGSTEVTDFKLYYPINIQVINFIPSFLIINYKKIILRNLNILIKNNY